VSADAPVLDEAGFEALTAKIARDRGFGCAAYKAKCLRRRIAVRMRAKGVHTYADYALILDADALEYDRLIDALTINVTKLFRNWDTWAAMERTIIPALWDRREDRLRVWSAGCSSGEEAYSVAMLFHRHAERMRELHRLSRVVIVGTDIDRDSLRAAERATFDESAFGDTPADVRTRYFGTTPPFALRPEIRAMVSFERRDLLADAPPGPQQHLIVCRNVLIYFDRATQESLFEHFHEVLAPGGCLVLGKVETLLGRARTLFVPVEGRERIFRRQ